MYMVEIEYWKQVTDASGKTELKSLNVERRTYEEFDYDTLAENLTTLMREREDRFSGMEEFGQGACECDGQELRPCCVETGLESCRGWFESVFRDMKPGAEESFSMGGIDWVSVGVKRV